MNTLISTIVTTHLECYSQPRIDYPELKAKGWVEEISGGAIELLDPDAIKLQYFDFGLPEGSFDPRTYIADICRGSRCSSEHFIHQVKGDSGLINRVLTSSHVLKTLYRFIHNEFKVDYGAGSSSYYKDLLPAIKERVDKYRVILQVLNTGHCVGDEFGEEFCRTYEMLLVHSHTPGLVDSEVVIKSLPNYEKLLNDERVNIQQYTPVKIGIVYMLVIYPKILSLFYVGKEAAGLYSRWIEFIEGHYHGLPAQVQASAKSIEGDYEKKVGESVYRREILEVVCSYGQDKCDFDQRLLERESYHIKSRNATNISQGGLNTKVQDSDKVYTNFLLAFLVENKENNRIKGLYPVGKCVWNRDGRLSEFITLTSLGIKPEELDAVIYNKEDKDNPHKDNPFYTGKPLDFGKFRLIPCRDFSDIIKKVLDNWRFVKKLEFRSLKSHQDINYVKVIYRQKPLKLDGKPLNIPAKRVEVVIDGALSPVIFKSMTAAAKVMNAPTSTFSRRLKKKGNGECTYKKHRIKVSKKL